MVDERKIPPNDRCCATAIYSLKFCHRHRKIKSRCSRFRAGEHQYREDPRPLSVRTQMPKSNKSGEGADSGPYTSSVVERRRIPGKPPKVPHQYRQIAAPTPGHLPEKEQAPLQRIGVQFKSALQADLDRHPGLTGRTKGDGSFFLPGGRGYGNPCPAAVGSTAGKARLLHRSKALGTKLHIQITLLRIG